ncbi:MAG: hypothetical protein Q9217_003340, partial [Psora testacea]
MAASLQRAEIVLRLLQAGAYPDTQDNTDRTPLQYATSASDIRCMSHLLKYKAEVNDESLHIAARQLDLAAVRLLLDHHARTDLPGTVHCGGRTPLGEICRMADLTKNSSQLKTTLVFLCEATTNPGTLSKDRSLIVQALDNHSPIKMATALLTSCQPVRDGLNDDFNIFSKGSLRYSPSGYVRHFKCVESRSHRSLDFSWRCCNHNACPAPKLEDLLHAYGCKDRFWDANAGANQPEAFCNPPSAIITAMNEAEAILIEQARRYQMQRDLDAAAAADRRRERERLRVREEERAAEIRAMDERTAAETRAIQQRARAEEQERQLLAAAEAEQAEMKRQRELREYNAQRERERREFNDQEERERLKDLRANKTLRERSNMQIDQKKREANIRKELLKEERTVLGEKRKLVDSATGMFREAGYSGLKSNVSMGRVLGEID